MSMGKCRVSVLKCCFDAELKARYIPDPDYGPCPYFSPGQVFETAGECPEGFRCQVGWKSIRDEAAAMCGPDPFFKEQVVCCSDGIRPVLFLLEAIK